jgi:hypothetical protein
MVNDAISSVQRSQHLFVSYEVNDEILVRNFINNLRKQLNIDVWFDKEKLTSSMSVNEQIYEGISESEMFLCFMTRLYSLSDNCIDEVLYAKNEKKRILFVMLEYASGEELGEVGAIMNGRSKINAYKEISLFKDGFGDEFKKLLKSLTNVLDVSLKIEGDNHVKKSLKKSKNEKYEKNDNGYFSSLMKGKIKF